MILNVIQVDHQEFLVVLREFHKPFIKGSWKLKSLPCNSVRPCLRFLCWQFYECHVLCKVIHLIFYKDGPWAKKYWKLLIDLNEAVGLKMRSTTWNRFPIEIVLLDWNSSPVWRHVTWILICASLNHRNNTDMCKFDESTAQSADFWKA